MTEPRNLKKLIAEMTLEEKAELCGGADFWHTKGVERLGIPAIRVADGPHGLRVQKQADDHLGIYMSEPSTCFPTAAGTASSWNVELLREMGAALGEECQAEEVGILLGPGVNIKRSPLCGRNFEYYSEDPYLSSRLAAAFIEGVQSQGVGTSLKHFAVNNQEHRRMTVNAVLDERTLREIYLASFEGAVKQAKPWTVMCSYNKVNGEYASENKYLLTDILKEEWGHEGFVVSDWGATNERVKGLAAGLELEMPFDAGSARIMESVQKGELSEEVLDQSLERLLAVVFKAYDSKKADAMYDRDAHHQLARKVAHESMVLLKNEDHILPLPKKGKIAVVGELAVSPRFQGGGSSHVNPNKIDDILSELARAAGEAEIIFSQGYKLAEDAVDPPMSLEAVEAAQKADSVLIFAGLPERYESEGYDRTHLSIPANQLSLIQEIAAVQPNVVVVLSNGSPVEMPWLDQAKGVLECYLGGQALGSAAADLIFGDVNPSGKLAESFPKKLEHNPSHPYFPGEGDSVEYREGLFVGYRYYDSKAIEPLFPFGHGLSYTSFEYSNLTVDRYDMLDTDTLTVRLMVCNTGSRAGKEVVQLYVRDVQSQVILPVQELKGFVKVELQPGEQKMLSFTLDKRAFAYYNTELRDWHVETGEFQIIAARSSRDAGKSLTVHVTSTTTIKKTFTRNSTIGDILADPVARAIVEPLLKQNAGVQEDDSDAAHVSMAMMMDAPVRVVVAFSQGAVSEEMVEALLNRINEQNQSS